MKLPMPGDPLPNSARSIADLFESRLGIEDFPYSKADSGRPIPHHGFDWSVSHSGTALFIAAAPFAIGVDIEKKKHRDASVWKMFHPSFSAFDDGTDEGFYAAWTSAESVAKLLWTGIDTVPFLRLEKTECALTTADGMEFFRISDIVSNKGRHRAFTGRISEHVYSVAL